MSSRFPETPDRRYFIVKDRLWRLSNPELDAKYREKLVAELMQARRDVGAALKADNQELLKKARTAVHRAKVELGERGPVWWHDGTPDYNRYLVKNTPYAEWYSSLSLSRSI